ncbi:MAG: hypothetical protein ABW039_11820 [Sphingobium sp.]
MDLGFQRSGGLKPTGLRKAGFARAPAWPFLRAAAAAAQAGSPTAQALTVMLRGQHEQKDWIQELAEIFAPRSDGTIEAVGLAGSFNPLVASRFVVGQE